MNVLLDTCAIVWTVSEPERLSTEALKVLTSPEVTVYFSPISSAEPDHRRHGQAAQPLRHHRRQQDPELPACARHALRPYGV